MRVYDLIKKKRDGGVLSDDEIAWIIDGYTKRESIPDYQMSAMLMAVFVRGLSSPELTAWTRAMLESGEVVDLSHVPGVKIDKHSTGGVGDKVSICLAPLVAACGVPVPMVSGRGLGHTGGTLDKLESIAGFNVRLSTEEFRRIVAEHGLCLMGQTPTLAPADRKLYALRDVTATVDSVPLIASSIMSKKLAEGIDGLVLDVKTGTGAFMKTLEMSRILARTLVDIGRGMNKRMCAFITDMNQPLGRAVGNASELIEALEVLHGRGPEDLVEITLVLGAEMLIMGEKARDEAEARALLREAMERGTAAEKMRAVIAAQGGDPGVVDDYSRLPGARRTDVVTPKRAGHVVAVDTESVGIAAILLGAGRDTVDSPIDHGVGLVVHKRLGDRVEADEPLVTLHYNDDSRLEEAQARLRLAFRLGERPERVPPLIHERVA